MLDGNCMLSILYFKIWMYTILPLRCGCILFFKMWIDTIRIVNVHFLQDLNVHHSSRCGCVLFMCTALHHVDVDLYFILYFTLWNDVCNMICTVLYNSYILYCSILYFMIWMFSVLLNVCCTSLMMWMYTVLYFDHYVYVYYAGISWCDCTVYWNSWCGCMLYFSINGVFYSLVVFPSNSRLLRSQRLWIQSLSMLLQLQGEPDEPASVSASVWVWS